MNDMAPEKKQRSALGKWSRRGFIGAGVLAGGGLLIGIGVRPGNPIASLAPKVAPGEGEFLVNSWVKIDTDNIVTAIVPHCEMGQGVHSVLGQMLAEELDADWSKVRVMQAPTDGSYVVTDTARMFVAPFTVNAADWIEPTWNGLFTQIGKFADAMITGGSSSIRTTGQHSMRIAGASARKMLIGAASDEWGVPAREITTRDSTLFHEPSGKSAPYAEFATAAADQPMDQTPELKPSSAYRLIGKSKARTEYENILYLERPGCNLCMGNQEKAAKGDTVLATSTRLFQGRVVEDSADKKGESLLASTPVVVLSAILGRTPSMEEYKSAVEGIDLTKFAPPLEKPAGARSVHF